MGKRKRERDKKGGEYFFVKKIKRADFFLWRKEGQEILSACRIRKLFTNITFLVHIKDYNTDGCTEILVCVLQSMKRAKIRRNG